MDIDDQADAGLEMFTEVAGRFPDKPDIEAAPTVGPPPRQSRQVSEIKNW